MPVLQLFVCGVEFFYSTFDKLKTKKMSEQGMFRAGTQMEESLDSIRPQVINIFRHYGFFFWIWGCNQGGKPHFLF